MSATNPDTPAVGPGNAPAPSEAPSATTASAAPSGDDVTLRPDGLAVPPSRVFTRGRVVGRFVLLERLGQGGMGVVYLAYDPQLERRVALKVMHPETADGDTGTARLLREAQALAQLNHPNVVAIHEVGSIEDGVYLAMEYVDGQTLGVWLRERPRTWREIVTVFVAAAGGLAAAHDVGLVHRDIKPDNLIVGSDGRVRVLDFGLARGNAGDRAARTQGIDSSGTRSVDVALTAAGDLLGTPLYMAPEQFNHGDPDARTDVWALCVTLWEALYGSRPFAGTSLAELAANVCAGRLVAPPRAGVPGWLHAVLLRGIATDPQRRFATMRALVADLGRDPMRRVRRLAYTVAGLTVAGLGVIAARTPEPCAEDIAVFDGIWDGPRREAVRSMFSAVGKRYADDSFAAVSGTLDEYAASLVDARREACEATRVYGTQSDAVLERRVACLDRRIRYLAGLTDALVAGGLDTVAHAAEATSGLPRVDDCARSDRLLGEPALPEDPTRRSEARAVRGEAQEIAGRIAAGLYDGVDERLDALDTRARALEYDPALAETLVVRGRWERRRGRLDAAAEHLAEALTKAESTGHDLAVIEAASTQVLVEGAHRDRFDVADVYARIADARLLRVGDDAALRVVLLTNIGQNESARGRKDDALATLSRAVEIERGVHGSDAAQSTYLRHAFAIALTEAGRYDEAEATLATLRAQVDARVGPHHPDAALVLSVLARLRTAQQRFEESIALSQQSRAVLEAAYGPVHADVAAAHNAEGRALSRMGRDADAAQSYARALEIVQSLLGPDHPTVATGLANLAAVHIRMGRAAEAVPALERALEIRGSSFGADHAMVGFTADLLGDARRDVGAVDGARAAYGRALAVFEAVGGEDDPRLAHALVGMAALAEDAGDRAAARMHLERALAVQGADAGAEPRGDLRFALARVLVETDPARADAMAAGAREAYLEAGLRGTVKLASLERWVTDAGRPR